MASVFPSAGLCVCVCVCAAQKIDRPRGPREGGPGQPVPQSGCSYRHYCSGDTSISYAMRAYFEERFGGIILLFVISGVKFLCLYLV
uniref:Putative secreted peptide n=1 Tax=Anopheles braziliensis TaxID=58242 RepID=A0A2M3ZP11_9DIPT